MGDIGNRLRALFDEEAHPIDPAYIPRTVQRKTSLRRRFSVRPGWQVGIAAGLIALVFGGAALLLRMDGDGGIAGQTISATQPNESVPAAPSQEASIEWTQGTRPAEFNVHTITAAGGYFIGLAWDEIEEPNPRTRLWMSEDGANWEAIDVDATAFGMRAGYFRQISTIGDGFIAIVKGESLASGLAELVVVTSTDARAWVPADIGGSGAIPLGVAGDRTGGIVVVESQDGDRDDFDVWHSIDATTWTLAASRTFSGIGGPKVEVIGGKFYLLPSGEGEGLWSSSDASEWTRIELPPLGPDSHGWKLPAGSPAGLLLFTNGASGSQLWLMATDNTWTEITPEGFDVPFAPSGGFGDQFISSSDGGPTIIIDDTVGPGANEYLTTIWWTLDGAQWTELPGSKAFGFEGTIRLASAKGNKIVILYTSETDRVGSLWTGVVAEVGASDTSTATVPDADSGAAALSGQLIEPMADNCSAELEGFRCEFLVDGSLETEWQTPEGGIGAQMSFAFNPAVRITEVGFTNLPQEERFLRNARIKGVEVIVNDLPQASIAELADDNSATQWIAVDSIRTSVLTITVTSAYPGVSVADREPFAELALAELSFRGSEVIPGTNTDSLTTLPYLILDVEGRDLRGASDSFSWCHEGARIAPARGSSYTTGLFLTVQFGVSTVKPWCGEPIPDSPSDLGPPADPPDVVDHGLIPVMGTQGRVIEHMGGVFSIYWIVSDGMTAQISIYPTPDDEVTLQDAITIADGVVELTAEQWTELVRGSPADEAEFTASNMPGALYDDAVDGLGPSPFGLALQSALSAAGPSRLDSMRIIDVQTDDTAGVTYEQVMFGDGSQTGYIMVFWQTLLGDEDISSFVGEFGEIRSEGPFDIITDVRDDFGQSFRLVRVYDGAKVLSVQANDIVGLEIDELIPLAKELFGLLPD